MSLLKPKAKRNTWSQEKRARRAALAATSGIPGSRILLPKSQAHLERIARRMVSRIHRKQQEEAARSRQQNTLSKFIGGAAILAV